MSFIREIPESEATGKLRDLYDADLKTQGYVNNHLKVFSLRPEALEGWRTLIGAIRGKMRLRLYELVTVAAASELECTYCMLAHGSVLRKNGFDDQQIVAIGKDFHAAKLEPAEVAAMAYARKLARNSASVTQEDIEGLKSHGFSDEEICDIALAASARSFFSNVLNGLGAEPDKQYAATLPGPVIEALEVGRPFKRN